MVLLSIFYTNQIHGGSSADCSLFILSLHALALHLVVKILLQIFRMKIWARWPYIHLSVVFPSRMPDRTFVTQPILLSETFLIFDINHQQKHKEVRPDWNDKNDNANYAPSYHMWKVLPMAQVAIFKEIFDQVRKDLDCELFYSELKRHNVSHYIYYLATDNIHTC